MDKKRLPVAAYRQIKIAYTAYKGRKQKRPGLKMPNHRKPKHFKPDPLAFFT